MDLLSTFMPGIAGLLAVLAGVYHWQRHNLFFRLIFWLAFFGAATEILCGFVLEGYFTLGRGQNNVPIVNVYLLLEVWISMLAIGSLFKSRKLHTGLLISLLLLTGIWILCIWQRGWFNMVIWFYLPGSIVITALLFYVIKVNLETYMLSHQLTAYLLIIFGQLLFFGVAFETLALRFIIIELGDRISNQTSMVLWFAAQFRLYSYLLAFLFLRKEPKASLNPALS